MSARDGVGWKDEGERERKRGQTRLDSQEEATKRLLLNSLNYGSPDGQLRYKTQKTPRPGP